MSANGKAAAAVAVAVFFVMANAASAEHRAGLRRLPRAFERAYGYVPRQPPAQAPQYNSRADAFSSDSLGRQSFPNPDRDFSIENLRSHPSD
jgi:hypothetical protein